MTKAKTIVQDLESIATVENAHEHDDSQFAVEFAVKTVPKGFHEKMLSQGFAVSRIDTTDGVVAFYKRITEF